MKTAGLAIAALIVGIAAIVMSWIPILGFILPVLAVIFGALALRAIKLQPEQLGGRGMAITGLVLGIIGLIPAIIILTLCGGLCAGGGLAALGG